MHQLNGHDAAFLSLESADVALHGAGLCILEASTQPLTRQSVLALLRQRLHLAPALSRHLVNVPLGLDQPYWVDDEVELAWHVRELWLPAGADEGAMLAEVARLHAQPLDRSRPLWELHLLHGLPEGRQALLLKVHHAVIDGVGGNQLLDALFDPMATGRTVEALTHPRVRDAPSPLGLLARSAFSGLRRPVQAVTLAGQLARSAPAVLREPTRRRLPVVDRLRPPADARALSDVGLRAPATPFNCRIGRDRVVVTRTLPLADVKAVRSALGVTVNDVFMAICTAALRRWLDEAGALPDTPLVACVPVSSRIPDEAQASGNQFGLLLALLPTDLNDPLRRATSVAASMRGAKRTYGSLPPSLVSDLASLLVPFVLAAGVRVSGALSVLERVRPFNVMISNVPGPPQPMWFQGSRVVAYYPLSQVVDGQGLNITARSYADSMDIGLVADAGVPLALERLGELLVLELRWLVDAVAGGPAAP